jgi:hypothetical protein
MMNDRDPWQPWREDDLLRIPATADAVDDAPAPSDASVPGWHVVLASGHVIAPAITVAHRTVLAVAQSLPRSGSCEVFVRTDSLDVRQSARTQAGRRYLAGQRLPEGAPAAASFQFGTVQNGIAPCLLAGQRITACDVDTRPRKTWWRRVDAE